MNKLIIIAFWCILILFSACQSEEAGKTETIKAEKAEMKASDEAEEERDLSGNKKSDVEKFKKMVPSSKEVDEVKESYGNYKETIMKSDGKAALKDINQGSIEYYDNILKWVRSASKSEILELDPVDQFMVLSVRSRLPKAEAVNMKGKDLLAYTIDNEWTNKSTVSKTHLGEIQKVGDNRIRSSMAVEKMNTSAFIEFERKAEGEPWKVDLVSLSRNVNDQFIRMAGDQEKPVNEVILTLIGQIVGKEVGDEIWKPFN